MRRLFGWAVEVDTTLMSGRQAVDNKFGVAARRAGLAMRKERDEGYEAAGANLAEYLISDRPLGPGERLTLALLVLGALRPSPTKPPLTPTHPDVAPVVERLRQL